MRFAVASWPKTRPDFHPRAVRNLDRHGRRIHPWSMYTKAGNAAMTAITSLHDNNHVMYDVKVMCRCGQLPDLG